MRGRGGNLTKKKGLRELGDTTTKSIGNGRGIYSLPRRKEKYHNYLTTSEKRRKSN